MFPRVTVVIPFYNCPYVEQAITSALSQTYPNVEIIVVDDGSTREVERIVPFLPRIHYLGKANGGTGSAINHGIRSASGEYIAWLSSDDKFVPDKIERQVAFLQKMKGSFCFSAYATMDHGGRVLEHFKGSPISSPKDIYRLLSDHNPINGCTTLIRRDLFHHYGYFNEGLSYTQDYDMWLRFALNGVRIHYLPEALTLYRFHEKMGSIQHREALLKEFSCVNQIYASSMQQLLQMMS